MHSRSQTEPTHWFYRFAIWFSRLLLDLFSRWSVSGLEHVPPEGALLVTSNHQNNVDPPILVAMIPRVLHCMAKQEMFVGPVGFLSRWYGAFPVRRGTPDRQAIRTALDHLAAGRCVGIFPEGTRSRTGALIEAHTGAGLLALRSGAPVLPVAIAGTAHIDNAWSVLRRP